MHNDDNNIWSASLELIFVVLRCDKVNEAHVATGFRNPLHSTIVRLLLWPIQFNYEGVFKIQVQNTCSLVEGKSSGVKTQEMEMYNHTNFISHYRKNRRSYQNTVKQYEAQIRSVYEVVQGAFAFP